MGADSASPPVQIGLSKNFSSTFINKFTEHMHTSFESSKTSKAASKFWYVKATLRLRYAYHVFAYNE